MSAESAPPQVPLNSYVGFDTITSQIEKRLLKRGFNFNVIVVGETGLGKSTLINTIFSAHLIESKGRKRATEPIRQTVEIQPVTQVIEENGVRLKLTIVDTPGYGDQVNNTACWEPIIKYIKDQHATYLRKELTAVRDRFIPDTRIHCCLFFISPSGHSLKPLDIEVLKRLTGVVNVVPVIAKSDTLTPEERLAFKKRIKQELVEHNIQLYPYTGEELEANEAYELEKIQAMVPFAIVGSEKTLNVGGQAIRGRRHRWGIVNVEDPSHCEFVHLRNFLTRTHLQDLIESTAYTHYERFRANQLLSLKQSQSPQQQPQQPQQQQQQPAAAQAAITQNGLAGHSEDEPKN